MTHACSKESHQMVACTCLRLYISLTGSCITHMLHTDATCHCINGTRKYHLICTNWVAPVPRMPSRLYTDISPNPPCPLLLHCPSFGGTAYPSMPNPISQHTMFYGGVASPSHEPGPDLLPHSSPSVQVTAHNRLPPRYPESIFLLCSADQATVAQL